MYGTVAHVKVKPGAIARLQELSASAIADGRLGRNGHIATYMYQSDRDPNEIIMVVLFSDRDAYRRNAASPDQNAQFEQMAQHFAAPPQWNDGEVIWEFDSRVG
jgi:quinol monooxygenase YgiN